MSKWLSFCSFNSQLLQLGEIFGRNFCRPVDSRSGLFICFTSSVLHTLIRKGKHYCLRKHIVTVGQENTFYYDLHLKRRETFLCF